MEQINTRLDHLERQSSEQGALIRDLHTAVVGSKLSQDGGIVSRIMKLESGQETIEEEIDDLKKNTLVLQTYQKIVWLVIGGAIVMLVKYGFSELTKKPEQKNSSIIQYHQPKNISNATSYSGGS